eukprot:jgi/Mesen1/5098/ME000252S04208
MWQFFLIAIPIVLGMVIYVLHHFASPKVTPHVRVVVAYAWFVSLSIVVLVPVDIWNTICVASGERGLVCGSRIGIIVMWSLAYWSAFFLTWAIVPTLQGYEDAGDFTVRERLKTSVRQNLILYVSVGVIGLIGVIILLATGRMGWTQIRTLAIGASNAFGLITGALLLGFGLVEVPRSLWKHADLTERQKWLTHKVAKVAERLDEAHQELSTAIVIAQATSTQMSRRDALRPIMDIIDALASEDATFKPSGGQIGENDMDYDADEKSMATLRRRLRKAQDMYLRYKTEYTSVVWQALELEDTLKNVDSGHAGERRFVSRLRPQRKGHLAPVLDLAEWAWRCVVQQQVVRAFAAVLAVMSVAIVFAEATLLIPPGGPDLSLFSVLIQTAASSFQEKLVQPRSFAVAPYSNAWRCRSVTKPFFRAPMCYNFLSLIHLTTRSDRPLKTTFETRMGALLLPRNFERIYPLVMVLYCILILSNVHNRVFDVFGSWRGFRFESDDDQDELGGEGGGMSSTGIILLRRERASLDRGMAIGENTVPLARHFAGSDDLEASNPLTPVITPSPSGTASPLHPAADPSKAPSKSPPLNPREARDMMASLYATLKGSSPMELPGGATKDVIAAKYALKRDVAAKGPHGHPGKASSAADLAVLGRSSSSLLAPRNLIDPLDARPAGARAGGGAGDHARPPVRNNSGDLISLGRDPAAQTGTQQDNEYFSSRARLQQHGVNPAAPLPPKASQRAGGLAPPPTSSSSSAPFSLFPQGPPPAGFAPETQRRSSENEGLLETRWDSMKSKLKDFTSKVRGSAWRAEDSGGGGGAASWLQGPLSSSSTSQQSRDHQYQQQPYQPRRSASSRPASSGGGAGTPSLDSIFEGLKTKKRGGGEADAEREGHTYSLLKAGQRGTNGGTFGSGGSGSSGSGNFG